ncbi:pantoate--beta-alanine ligase [Nocardioides panaciterrulae]|uniref:Pantothenate synthetase n=1 Tax=Nocardioides panaciterrulae TaxID=661492 RepID=A0A7Y9JCL3_9ACTN|nr:pantoate--beta-alanine ligase [Nocardioides panaciterrulae]
MTGPGSGRGTRLVSTREELAGLLGEARAGGRRVGLVPTMGALHEGHASLVRVARERVGDGPVVVSVFVNPLQFGEGEDLDRYPRTLAADLAVCEREGVDVVFAPGVEEVYPGGEPQVTVEPGPLATVLEGSTRPGHFRGVLTVVAKLFGLVRPDVAVFGEKDYQQLVLIRRMVLDLNLGVEVVGAPTRREADGLALSSRNAYLDAGQRAQAVGLSAALQAARDASERGAAVALDAARAQLRRWPGVDLDYLALTDPELGELPGGDVPPGTPARILVAARVGATRLIDNMPLTLGDPHARPANRERSEPGSAEPKVSPAKPAHAVPYERSE